MRFYFKFRHFVRHQNSTDVISCLYKMKRTDWLVCLEKTVIGSNSKFKKFTKK